MNPDDPATLDHGEVVPRVNGRPLDKREITASSIDT